MQKKGSLLNYAKIYDKIFLTAKNRVEKWKNLNNIDKKGNRNLNQPKNRQAKKSPNIFYAIKMFSLVLQSRSLECGMATGCVKIVKRAKEFDPDTGKFIPEERRAKSVDLFKGSS